MPFFPLRGPRDANPDDLDLRLERTGSKTSLRVNLRQSNAGRNVLLGYLVDCSSREEKFAGLRLDWRDAPAGFMGSLRIDASEDLKTWITVVDRAPLISLQHGGHRVVQKTVTIPPQRAKYLRLTWPADSHELQLTCSLIGGGIDSNVERWVGQFQMPAGEKPQIEPISVGTAQAKWVELHGTFSAGMMSREPPQENWRMIGVGIPLGQRDFFLKLTGPSDSVAAVRDEFRTFVKSARLNTK